MFLALGTAPRAGGLNLPPTADARVQLWCIAAVALIAVVAIDGWLGLGVSVRALAADRFTAVVVGCTIALAATPSLMVFDHVHARGACLTVAAAQFVWSFGGLFLCGAVSERRKRQVWRADDLAAASAGQLGEHDLVPESAGHRKILVINAVVTITGLPTNEAMDLVDDAPGPVPRQITADRPTGPGNSWSPSAQPSPSAPPAPNSTPALSPAEPSESARSTPGTDVAHGI